MYESPNPTRNEPGERKHSVLSLVLLIGTVAFAGAVFLAFTFWAFGLVFHTLGFLVHIALIVAVVALVWRLVTRGRWRRT